MRGTLFSCRDKMEAGCLFHFQEPGTRNKKRNRTEFWKKCQVAGSLVIISHYISWKKSIDLFSSTVLMWVNVLPQEAKKIHSVTIIAMLLGSMKTLLQYYIINKIYIKTRIKLQYVRAKISMFMLSIQLLRSHTRILLLQWRVLRSRVHDSFPHTP